MSSPSPAKKAKKSKSILNSTGVMDYLQTCLPRSALLELYQDDDRGLHVCRAVLQRLPEVTQQVVIRLSCCGGSFPRQACEVWSKGSTEKQLKDLHSWAIILPPKEGEDVTLTPEFFKGLQSALHCLDASPWNALTQAQMDYIEQEAAKVHGNNHYCISSACKYVIYIPFTNFQRRRTSCGPF